MGKPSTSGIPAVDAMTDTLDFVKNLWGGMKVPGMVMPTLSVDEINKQIADLKAVESWLTLNMNMLRGTIQALEVQSSTIATLQSMSETFNAASKPMAPAKQDKPVFESPFSFPPPAAKPAPAPALEPAPEPVSDAANQAVPFANPAAWWNMLQDQFNQAVNTAMAADAGAAAVKPAAAPRKRKPGKA